jgi:hypothetical protein
MPGCLAPDILKEDGEVLMGLKFLIIFWGLLGLWEFVAVSHTIAPNTIAPNTLSSQPATQVQFGEAARVDPDPPATLVGGVVVICDTSGSIRNVVLYDTSIEILLFVQKREAASIPQGELLEEPDAARHDASRLWRPGPQAV